MIALTSEQLKTVMLLAKQLRPLQRDAFLRASRSPTMIAVAARSANHVIGSCGPS